MTVVEPLLSNPIAGWISEKVRERLSDRAQSCAINARNHLVRAQHIADISTTISFFCATHATEEAVACFVSTAKETQYAEIAKDINLHDHAQKVVVSSYAQVISGYLENEGACIAHEPVGNRLYAKFIRSENQAPYPLSLRLFSFNEDGDDPSHKSAHDAFTSWFPSSKEMVKHVLKRASYRDEALYAKDKGAPDMRREVLDASLMEHTLLTLGLTWAAIDMTYHEEPEPFVTQILGAISAVISEVRPPRVCKYCGN